MPLDDRFDDLVASLGGFHRSWLVYLGIELGLFEQIRAAGAAGLTPDELAERSGCEPRAIEAWSWAADAHELVELEDDRLTIDDDVAVVLLDANRSEFLGGQFVHAAVASLDWGGMVDFFRTGQPIRERPDRYRAAIERLTAQLEGMLEHFEDIDALQLDDVEPMTQPYPLRNVFREDVVLPSLDRDEVLAAAPDVEDGRFRVPPIIGLDS